MPFLPPAQTSNKATHSCLSTVCFTVHVYSIYYIVVIIFWNLIYDLFLIFRLKYDSTRNTKIVNKCGFFFGFLFFKLLSSWPILAYFIFSFFLSSIRFFRLKSFNYITNIQTNIHIFVVIITMFRPFCPLAFFRCLSIWLTFREFLTELYI